MTVSGWLHFPIGFWFAAVGAGAMAAVAIGSSRQTERPGETLYKFFLCLAAAVFCVGLYLWVVASMYAAYLPAPAAGSSTRSTAIQEGPAASADEVAATNAAESTFFAVQTLTTTGYGFELNAKANKDFYRFSSCAMLIGAALWAIIPSIALLLYSDYRQARADADRETFDAAEPAEPAFERREVDGATASLTPAAPLGRSKWLGLAVMVLAVAAFLRSRRQR